MKEITLDDIDSSLFLSKHSLDFCQVNGLNSISSIKNFFLSEENSTEIERLDSDARTELKALCKQYLEGDFKYVDKLDISLQQLSILENMSQRAVNICDGAGLRTLQAILEYRHSNRNFSQIRNCGIRTNQELIHICDKYSNLYVDDLIEIQEEEQMSLFLKENIDLHTLAGIEKISTRSYNLCKDAGLDSLRKIIQYYFDNKSKGFLWLRNCGKSSNKELINICLKYGKYEGSTSYIKNGKLIVEVIHSPIDDFINSLRLPSADYQKVKDIVAGLDYIPLFKILDILIDSHFVFHNENDTIIFKDTFNCYLPPVNNTLEAVGKRIGLTRERVRQIRESIYRRLFQSSFRFIKTGASVNIFPEYIQSTDPPIILISDEETERINQKENTRFSPLFITFILSQLLNDNFIMIGDRKTLFGRAAFKETFSANHLFSVNQTIASQFQFGKFLYFLKSNVSKGREEDEKVTYIELISKFKSRNATNIQAIVSAVNAIVVSDFNHFVEIRPDGLNFYQNKKKSLTTQITEVLRNSATPLHYSEIYRQLVSCIIDNTTEQSVHSVLIIKNKIFGLKGAGMFDLRSKGGLFGTIGDVAEEILNNRNVPVPLPALENLICKELAVSKKSIHTILFNYSNEHRFERDRNGNVKLTEWQKNTNLISAENLKQRRTIRFSNEDQIKLDLFQ